MKDEKKSPKKVIAFGTFDHFHAGHENYLTQAKAQGDHLTVIIARDKTVQKIKGELPEYNEKERLKAVEASEIADKVVLGNLDNKYKVLKKHRPHIIALGYDQYVFTYRLKKAIIDMKLDAEIVRLESYHPSTYKSSIIKAQKKQTPHEEL